MYCKEIPLKFKKSYEIQRAFMIYDCVIEVESKHVWQNA